MTSRERVLAALNHEQPDRPPLFASFVPEIASRLRETLGIREADLGVAMGNDMVKTCVGLELSFYGGAKPEYTCP
jgi:uroporphyrinogen decarboxylase